MRHVRRRLGGQAPIKVVNFDWHGNMGRLTEEKAVEGFWSLMEPFVKQTGFAAGWMEAAPDAAPATPTAASAAAAAKPDASGAASASAASSGAAGEAPGTADTAAAEAAPATAWPPGWSMRWSRQQAGLLRFNCADSLDRTNAATCFAMLPVLQEQLRVLGLALECAVPPATAALQRSRGRSSNDVAGLAGQQQQGQQQGPTLEDVAASLPEVRRIAAKPAKQQKPASLLGAPYCMAGCLRSGLRCTHLDDLREGAAHGRGHSSCGHSSPPSAGAVACLPSRSYLPAVCNISCLPACRAGRYGSMRVGCCL
jgi:hypothetical protein